MVQHHRPLFPFWFCPARDALVPLLFGWTSPACWTCPAGASQVDHKRVSLGALLFPCWVGVTLSRAHQLWLVCVGLSSGLTWSGPNMVQTCQRLVPSLFGWASSSARPLLELSNLLHPWAPDRLQVGAGSRPAPLHLVAAGPRLGSGPYSVLTLLSLSSPFMGLDLSVQTWAVLGGPAATELQQVVLASGCKPQGLAPSVLWSGGRATGGVWTSRSRPVFP